MSENGKELIKPAYFVNEEDKNEKGLIVPAKFEDEKRKGPELKQYLILFYFISAENDSDITKTFEIVTGRTNARELIKNNIEEIDVHESKILVEGVTMEDMISVYEFMKHIEFNYSDGFDIEDYNFGDDEIENYNNYEVNEEKPSAASVLNPTYDNLETDDNYNL